MQKCKNQLTNRLAEQIKREIQQIKEESFGDYLSELTSKKDTVFIKESGKGNKKINYSNEKRETELYRTFRKHLPTK